MKTLLMAGLVLFTGVAMAQPGQGRGMGMRIVDELNLTDQQQKQVDQIHNDAMKQGIDRRAELAKARVDLQQLARADNPDQALMSKKVKEIESLRSEMTSHRLNTWFAINKILTPEQQKIWKQTLERRIAHGPDGLRNEMPMRGMMRDRMMRDGMMRDGIMRRGVHGGR